MLTFDPFAELHPSGSRPDVDLPQDYIISPRREQEGTDDTRLDWVLLRETACAQALYADGATGHQFSTGVSGQVIGVCAFCLCLAVAILARRWAS